MALDQSQEATRTAPDHDEIVGVIQLYFDGFDDGGSVEKFHRCFHEDAWILFTDSDGELHQSLIADCFEDWAGDDPCESRIISVIQAGDLARVLIEMHWPSDPAGTSWVDIHSLLRINDVWTDMNKTATHASRAAWAGAIPALGEEAAETPDRDEIVRVVQLYIDGFNDADIEKFREAFHPEARITYTDRDGELHGNLIYDCIENWSSDDPGEDIHGRIIAVTQAGDVASVLLGFDYKPDPADGWVDIHNLLRMDGVWKITNKTATHASRASWAAPSAPTSA
jgi:hypothetical protein